MRAMVYGPATPEVPAAQLAVRYPKSIVQAVIRGSVGVVLIAAGAASQILGAGFPYNAPVEQFTNFAITVTLVLGGIALIVFGIVAAVAASVPASGGPLGAFAITGAVLVVIAVLAWLGGGLPVWLEDLGNPAVYRYSELTGASFVTGLPWVVGIVFATLGLRRPERASRIVCWVAIGLGLLLLIPALGATAMYGAGLTD